MAGTTAMPTPWFLPTATVKVDRNNKRADEQLLRVITELDLKKRKSVKKIEERIKYVKEELRNIFDNVDLSTDIHESPTRHTQSEFVSRTSFADDNLPKRCKTKAKNDDIETESRSRNVHFLPNINNIHGSNQNITGDAYAYDIGSPPGRFLDHDVCVTRNSPDYDPVTVTGTHGKPENDEVIAKVTIVNKPKNIKSYCNSKPNKTRNKRRKKRNRQQTHTTKLPYLSNIASLTRRML